MAKIAHRASFLQAFHTGISETQRKAAIEAYQAEESKDVPAEQIDTKKFNKPAGQPSGNGVVRRISDRQVAFILRLIATKDITNLKILPGQTVKPDEIRTMGIKGGTALIEKLLACPDKRSDSVSIFNQGTTKQQNFLKNLMSRHNVAEADIISTYNTISEAITGLLNYKETPKESNKISEGMYTDGKRIIRVYTNRAGSRLLAKELLKEDNDYSFEYLGMAYRFVSDMRRMTIEEAKEFGMLTQTCCVCGIRLTDPDSQKKGIGPYCNKQF